MKGLSLDFSIREGKSFGDGEIASDGVNFTLKQNTGATFTTTGVNFQLTNIKIATPVAPLIKFESSGSKSTALVEFGGQVLDTDGETPVEGAEVQVSSQDTDTVETVATTDSKGKWSSIVEGGDTYAIQAWYEDDELYNAENLPFIDTSTIFAESYESS